MQQQNYELIFTDYLGKKTIVEHFTFFRPAVRSMLDRERHGEVRGVYKIVCVGLELNFQDELTIYSDGTGSLLRENKSAYDILDSKIIESFLRNAKRDHAKEESPHIIKLRRILGEVKVKEQAIQAINDAYNEVMND